MKAIILAAGMGTRLRPLTEKMPKALIKLKGIPMIERQLMYLNEKGIYDITVVTGYLSEQFNYLVDKFGVKLIHNDKYEVFNNIYTMYLVRDFLPGSYVIESDFFWVTNIIDPDPKESMCFCNFREKFWNEWIIRTDENNRIIAIEIGDGMNEYILSGLSYWTEKDGEFIKEKLEEAISTGEFEELYWDEIVKCHLSEMNVKLKRLTSLDSYEIDSVEDLRFVEKQIKIAKRVETSTY